MIPRRRRGLLPRLAALPGLLALAAAADAQSDPAADGLPRATETLLRVEQDLDEARRREETLSEQATSHSEALVHLRGQMIDAAMSIMMQHDQLMSVEQRMATLAAEEQEAEASLHAERQRLIRLLSALQRLSRVPPEALVVRPQAPIDTVRTALLLRAAVPELEREAASLRTRLAQLAAVQQRLSAELVAAQALRDRLDSQIATLNTMSEQRARLLRRATDERQAMADRSRILAEEAEDLRGLIEQLEIERQERERREREEQERRRLLAAVAAQAEAVVALEPQPEPEPDAVAAAAPQMADIPPEPEPEPDSAVDATLPGRPGDDGWRVVSLRAPVVVDGPLLPASGQVLVGFGQPDLAGDTSEGITLSVYPGSPIVAPIDGTVRFVGPFRRYGDILILEHRGGYHCVITGFGRIDAAVGQTVLAGEPLGVTGLPQTGDSDRPTLYLELRLNGRPVDPLQGLVMAQSRG